MSVTRRTAKRVAAGVLAVLGVGGAVLLFGSDHGIGRTHASAYFDSANGIYSGDEIRILGVRVGEITKITPEPERVKVDFWFDNKYRVPAEVNAVILSPSLVSARAIQLTPAYSGGPVLADNSVIPRERTVVPVEWDQFREQLQRLTKTLQPVTPGGVSTLGEFVDTAADNLRGRGPEIHETIVELSRAISVLGDHSDDVFSTVKNLSILTTALRDSDDVLRHLNRNLATASSALASDPQGIANAVADLSVLAEKAGAFVAKNREPLGAVADRTASISEALGQSIGDVKQFLHVAPNTAQNFLNIYQPAQGTLTGALSPNNLSDPISFVCGSVQAASRRNSEQAAKLCVQYLAPIVKNRQYNWLPLGENLFVGASARPNEITFSEDWLRPDHVPDPPAAPAAPPAQSGPPAGDFWAALPGQVDAAPANPESGLTGLLLPGGAQ
ncbi:mammalian cell entry protein [Mycolicibacter kumamotonensis]|uniref:Mammalian cell entry protein n=1 Tax=Mycolicibacter kumamotonensis TaxID=354243 RepID=A0A1X0DWW6_9MYCO|nr:MCE family protein [Mycolicibacter kumamotonensis]ORA76845.1 mammalian cell entry protein [Mycolicibacter kumamotonensis]